MSNVRVVDADERTSVIRELDHRIGDGIEVTLLWNARTKAVFVVLAEDQGGTFEFDVPPAEALEAFRHPYIYAAYGPGRGALAA